MAIPLCLFFFTFEIYLLTHCATFNINDSGETIMVCDLLTVSHSPGYPLHTLWGRLNCLLPIGQPMLRVTFASMLTASFSVVMVYQVLRIMLKGIFEKSVPPPTPDSVVATSETSSRAWLWEVPSVFGALVFAFSYQHWFQAGGAKGGIYTLNTLLFTLILFCLFKMREPGWFNKSFLMISFLFGLGLAHHLHDQVAFFPGYLLIILYNQKKVPLDDLYRWILNPIFPGVLAGFSALTFLIGWGVTSSASSGGALAVAGIIAGVLLAMIAVFFSVAVRFLGWWYLLFTTMGTVFLAMVLLVSGHEMSLKMLVELPVAFVILSILARIFGWVHFIRASVLCYLPVTTYLYLTFRAIQKNPPPIVNWWNPDNYIRLWGTIARKGYEDIGEKDYFVRVIRNCKRFFFHAQDQYGFVFTILIAALLIFGVWWLLKRQATTALAFTLMAFCILIGVFIYCSPLEGYQWTLDNFFATVFLVMAIFAAAGVAGLLSLLDSKFPGREKVIPLSAVVMVLGLTTLLLNYKGDDQSRYISSYDEGVNMLKTVNDDGVILCNGDIDILPLWYMQFVEGLRPKVVSFTMQLIPYDWYRDPLFNRWPFLRVPLRKTMYGQDDIRPEVVVQDMIEQHAKDRSFYFTNIFTAPWMREKNQSMPEGFLWRMVNTKNLNYAFTAGRLNILWDTYRLRNMDAPDRGYWDEYTDVMKDSYGIGYDFTGYFAYMNGMPDLALWSFDRALKFRQPQTLVRIYMMIGETYLAMGDAPSAINNYQETLKREPGNPYIFAKMGECFFLMKDYMNAQTAFQQSVGISQQVKQQPQAEAEDGLAVLNNPADAAKKFQEAIQKNDPKQNGYLYGQLGDAYFLLKKYTEAKNAYQKSLALNPGQVEAMNGLRMLGGTH